MPPYFTRERFGRPQFLAALLLLAFLGQAIWLVHRELGAEPFPEADEALRIGEGWKQWHGKGVAAASLGNGAEHAVQPELANEVGGFDSQRSPLLYLATAAPLLAWPHDLTADTARYWRWLPRIPFLACGVFLGASLWCVARRLCGNTGGFVALTFYCFSPSLIQASAVWHTEPEIAATWGSFGTIFTAIAVAHTLYAPREVVLWNWRRIVLLGVALAIAVGSQFSLIILVPMALGFLLYVAPVRRKAGLVIWFAACMVGSLLLFAMYFLQPRSFLDGLRHAEFWGGTWRGFTFLAVYKQVAVRIAGACPALALALPVTLATYQILTHRADKKDEFPHFKIFDQRDWGLIIYDEVHLLPAPVFRVTAQIQARRRLGLTATLIREDGRQEDWGRVVLHSAETGNRRLRNPVCPGRTRSGRIPEPRR